MQTKSHNVQLLSTVSFTKGTQKFGSRSRNVDRPEALLIAYQQNTNREQPLGQVPAIAPRDGYTKY